MVIMVTTNYILLAANCLCKTRNKLHKGSTKTYRNRRLFEQPYLMLLVEFYDFTNELFVVILSPKLKSML